MPLFTRHDRRRIRYGPGMARWAELWPAGKGGPGEPTGAYQSRGTVVLIHGGFWTAGYGCGLMRPLAGDLAGRGWRVWNLEYRRLGAGGGWPATFVDVAAGIDHLVDVDPAAARSGPVVAVGHSAGGHLALWAAARAGLPPDAPGSRPRLVLHGAASLAGVNDLVVAAETGVGGGVVRRLLGGGPEQVPDRYRLASPMARLPLGIPQLLVHGRLDRHVPVYLTTDYAAAARDAGDEVDEEVVEAMDHMAAIDPRSRGWEIVAGWLERRFSPGPEGGR